MDSLIVYLLIAVAILAVGGVIALALTRSRGAKTSLVEKPRPGVDYAPGVGDDATIPRDTHRQGIEDVELPGDGLGTATAIEVPAPAAGRLARLRARLAKSNTGFGRALLALLSSDRIDDAAWQDIEDTLILGDLGIEPAQELVESLRTQVRIEGTSDPEQVRQMLRSELLAMIDPTMDRAVASTRSGGHPAVVMVVGVNGTGKTTTTGKLARVLIADGSQVVLGAADTFRAAAADQLQTWGERVGAKVVRADAGADPAAVAFDAVRVGVESEADVVIIDTAGRLHTKVGLMDELGKVKRVIEKQAPVSEVLLVLDATTGQNGLAQARVFSDVVDITGIALTKLDGTAKGGIVVAVQRELGVPVKLVGLGEGPDDLAPFEPEEFVDALLA